MHPSSEKDQAGQDLVAVENGDEEPAVQHSPLPDEPPSFSLVEDVKEQDVQHNSLDGSFSLP